MTTQDNRELENVYEEIQKKMGWMGVKAGTGTRMVETQSRTLPRLQDFQIHHLAIAPSDSSEQSLQAIASPRVLSKAHFSIREALKPIKLLIYGILPYRI